jgi:hypothetical protein
MKQLISWVVFVGVAGYLIFATGFHKTVYRLVRGEQATDVRSTSYGATIR